MSNPFKKSSPGLAIIVLLFSLTPEKCLGITFRTPENPQAFELGKLLFHDKILSGNKNISCATCHSVLLGTGDGISLSVGEGGRGLGLSRITGYGNQKIKERVPRNSPPLFNLGAIEYIHLFADGRVGHSSSTQTGFKSPAGDQLPLGLESILAVQAIFPLTSQTEMAGQSKENTQGYYAKHEDFRNLWKFVADKVRAIPEYQRLFAEAYAVSAEEISIVHIGNAIATFEEVAFKSNNSHYDAFLNGDTDALTPTQLRGLELFIGKAGCIACHSGPLQTDHSFHAMAVPQFGPGKGDGLFSSEDFGRERVTKNPEDRYAFKTPSLRNVALTGPWGHTGAFATLESVIKHHLSPKEELRSYKLQEALLPPDKRLSDQDRIILESKEAMNNLIANYDGPTIQLNHTEIQEVIAFLHSLTDPSALDLRALQPLYVPSGLRVYD